MRSTLRQTVAELGSQDPRTDEVLLMDYRRTGDSRLFSELVQRYERELYNYLRRYLGDATLADDTFQMTFLQVHLKAEQFEADRRFRPWLYTIATHQAIDAQRRNRRHKSTSIDSRNKNDSADDVGALIELLSTGEPGPAAQLEEGERQAWVRKAVDKLPDVLRATVALVYFQGLKYTEAAELLSIPVGTVKSRLHAAMLKLNEAWMASHPQETEL